MMSPCSETGLVRSAPPVPTEAYEDAFARLDPEGSRRFRV